MVVILLWICIKCAVVLFIIIIEAPRLILFNNNYM